MILTQIFVEDELLDLTEEVNTEFTYTIDDILDFGSKNTSYSKTINIKGTANNNKIFGFVFDLGQANFVNESLPNVNYNFNASKIAKCKIFVDQVQIFKGSIRILSITIENGVISYECSVFGELGGLISNIGNSRLEDLDFSSYNHTYDVAHIQSSWDGQIGQGYFYPLIDYGNVSANKVDFNANAFRPALYVKEYLDKIFANAGYTYESDFLNSNPFKKLIIPHNQKELSTSSSLQLSLGAVQKTYNGNWTSVSTEWNALQLGNFLPNAQNNMFTYIGSTSKVVNLDVTLSGIWKVGGIAYLKVFKNGQDIGSFYIGSAYEYHYFNATISITGVTFNTNDILSIQVVQSVGVNYQLVVLGGSCQLSTSSVDLVPINYGEQVVMNQAIPKGIFQKDFLISIFKMFNLYVYDDKFKDKHIIIKPYIDFYDTNVNASLDFSQKIDRSKPIVITPMSQMNARYYQYSYKDDTDYYNENYKKKYNQSYGDIIYDSNFEFSTESNKVDIIFAPSFLFQQTGTDKKYPAIYKLSNNNTKEDRVDSVVRILTAKKITNVNAWSIKNFQGTSNIVTGLTSYGYAGHLDDPSSPTYDINFGAPKEIGVNLQSYPTANLFNAYHSEQMAEITDSHSKLLECEMYLTQNDIFNLDFSKLIYIDGFLFRLVKVDGYTPLELKTTKVTLLKVIETIY